MAWAWQFVGVGFEQELEVADADVVMVEEGEVTVENVVGTAVDDVEVVELEEEVPLVAMIGIVVLVLS